MRELLTVAILLVPLVLPAHALADAGGTFRRTTPRASLADLAGLMVIGVPGGRAWGVESGLRPLPRVDAVVVARIAVDDSAREAFLRVAYYSSATVRTRQLAIVDSDAVPAGESRIVAVVLDPPPGSVAYRVRVLARLAPSAVASRPDAISADLDHRYARRGLLSRLLQ